MTGTTEKKTPPRSDAEWARDVQQRVENVEHPTALRAGDWVLSTDTESGNLVASHVSGGTTILAKKPEDGDPDATENTEIYHLQVARVATQSCPAGSVDVTWDTLVQSTRDWRPQIPGSTIIIPEDGHYLCIYHLAWNTSSSHIGKAFFKVDGTTRMAQEYDPDTAWYQAMYLVETIILSAGQVISAGAFSSGTRNFGPSGADPSVYTTLSLTRLPIGD